MLTHVCRTQFIFIQEYFLMNEYIYNVFCSMERAKTYPLNENHSNKNNMHFQNHFLLFVF